MKFSKLAKRYSDDVGIVRLMDDLGDAMADHSDMLMLGGGNPAHIPAVQQYFRDSLSRLINDQKRFCHAVGDYSSPQGDSEFIDALVGMFNQNYQWNLSSHNIALTIGSQSAFFSLFNLFAGEDESGMHRQILLPLIPEYIGYADVGLTDQLFYSHKPVIDKLKNHLFKYRIDFDDLVVRDNTALICVSRPTNPTGNVISDQEIHGLLKLAVAHDVPLIIDNAYGEPFPDILFTETNAVWDEHVIYCMSLSKVGLPGTRTGIVIATEDVIRRIRNMNAIMNLAPPNIGSMIATDLIRSGELLRLSKLLIKPFYEQKAQQALDLIRQELDGINYFVHKPEGAIFLWLWIPDLPISALELYERLKQQNVLVIPGEYFFPGLEESWPHCYQCLRITYSMHEHIVTRGIQLIAKEIKQVLAATGIG